MLAAYRYLREAGPQTNPTSTQGGASVIEADTAKLLPMILDAAIELTEAERGFLVKVQGRKPDRVLKI